MKWSDQELQAMLAARRGGEKVSDIAKRVGRSRTRVHQLLRLAEHKESRPAPDPRYTCCLSTRARNVLGAEGVFSVTDLRARLAKGLDLARLPNCGVKTLEEIRAWAV